MSKVMFSLPNKLVERMRSMIPPGERSHVLARLLEQEIEQRENELFLAAKELESATGLQEEMDLWDAEFGRDGLEDV